MKRIVSLLALVIAPCWAVAEDVDDLLRSANQLLRAGKPEDALKAAEKAVAAEPKMAAAYFLRGEAHGALRHPHEAIKDFEKAYELDKKFIVAINQRGGERFKLGLINESIADFDAYLKENPKAEAAHWRRGISYYYAGQFTEGAKQFVDGQVEYGADVENAFWHYLCIARKDGVAKARQGILKLTGDDARVPMMRVYDLIQGKAKAEDVIAAAEKADLKGDRKQEALFYAHLYVALNYEAVALPISHYMWDVANVHAKRMKKK
jgi:lipoprotein NlpI